MFFLEPWRIQWTSGRTPLPSRSADFTDLFSTPLNTNVSFHLQSAQHLFQSVTDSNIHDIQIYISSLGIYI
jgi:hypothetical protein